MTLNLKNELKNLIKQIKNSKMLLRNYLNEEYKFYSQRNHSLFPSKLIETYGGTTGIRDEKLLDSTLEQPKAIYQGEYLHDNIYKMAAAYGYHLCNNHPFIKGNKRIALVAMNVFLQINGFEISISEKNAYKIIIRHCIKQLYSVFHSFLESCNLNMNVFRFYYSKLQYIQIYPI